MGQGDELDLEGTDGKAPGKRHHGDLRLAGQAGLGELAAHQGGGEGGRVDGASQARPEVGHGADVVLVGVGQDQPGQRLPAFDDEGRIGHEDVDARRPRLGEGDAQVGHQPGPGMAEKVEVHADLAGPAQGQEIKLVGAGNEAVGQAHASGFRLER